MRKPFRTSVNRVALGAALVAAAFGVLPASASAAALTVKFTQTPKPLVKESAPFKWKIAGGTVKKQVIRWDTHRSFKIPTAFRGITARWPSGKHTFRLTVTDTQGRTKTVAFSYMTDSTPPTAPLVSGNSDSWRNVASVTAVGSGSTDKHSRVVRYENQTQLFGHSWSALHVGNSAVVSAQGWTDVRMRTVDLMGNKSLWTYSTIKLDRTAPSVPTLMGGDSEYWHSEVSGTLNYYSEDNSNENLTYSYQKFDNDLEDWGPEQAAPEEIVVTDEGISSYRVRATDSAGNTSAFSGPTQGSTFMRDRTAPAAPASVTADETLLTSMTGSWEDAADTEMSGFAGSEMCVTTDEDGSSCAPPNWDAPDFEYDPNLLDQWTSPFVSGSGTVVHALDEETTYYFCVRTKDNAENRSGATCSTGHLPVPPDTTAPSAPAFVSDGLEEDIDFQAVPDPMGGHPLSANWAASTDTGGSGLAGYAACFTENADNLLVTDANALTGCTWAPIADQLNATKDLGGPYARIYVCVVAQDNAGNSSSPTCSDGQKYDPYGPMQSTVTLTQNGADLTGSWLSAAQDDGSPYGEDDEYCLTTSFTGTDCDTTAVIPWTTIARPGTETPASPDLTGATPGLADGQHYILYVRSIDEIGNTTNSYSDPVNYSGV